MAFVDHPSFLIFCLLELSLAIETHHILELGIDHSFDLAQLAKALKEILLPQKLLPFLTQKQRISVADANFFLSRNLSIGYNIQKSSIEILSAVWLTIVIDVVGRKIYSNRYPVSFAEEVLNREGIHSDHVELLNHFRHVFLVLFFSQILQQNHS
jgi:hypothetical protein